jgi:putative ABC transport system permease protein
VRALFRLGWREARRHRLRSVLVTALIGLPVAVGVVAITVGPSFFGWGETGPLVPGGADVSLDMAGVSGTFVGPDRLESQVEAVLDAVQAAVPGAAASVQEQVTAWRPASPVGADRTERAGAPAPTPVAPLSLVQQADGERSGDEQLVSGRAASGPDEVVLLEPTADQAGLSVGDRLSLALPDAELEVVGIAPGAEDCLCGGGLVAADAFDGPLSGTWSREARQVRVLVDAPAGMSVDELEQRLVQADLGVLPGGPGSSEERAVRWARLGSTVGVVFLLVWTGLIAATGLAVGARRRQRELGLLAANGADPSQLRLAVVAEGAVVGLVGTVAGAALGIVVSFALAGVLESATVDRPVRGIDLVDAAPWVLLVMSCGLCAAVLAARAAANGLGRLTPQDLLRGRRPPPRPAPHWFAAGAVSLAIGFAVAAVVARELARDSTYSNTRLTAVLVVVSLATVTVGLVATVVGASRLLPRLTSRTALPIRLAGRDLARHGLRVGASCGAVALTLAAAIAVATLFEDYRTAPASERVSIPSFSELPDGRRYLEVTTDGFDLVGDQVVDRTASVELGRELRADGFDVVTSQAYFAPPGLELCTNGPDVSLSGCDGAFVLVLDDTTQLRPEVRNALAAGRPASARGGGAEVWLAGVPVATFDLAGVVGHGVDQEGVGSTWSGWTTTVLDPNSVVVGPEGAARLGIDVSVPSLASRVLVIADHDDRGVEQRVRSSLVGTGADVVDAYPSGESRVGWFVAGGIAFVTLVTLLVVLFALALMRIESRGDDGVLAVSGASPSVLRRTQAARAAVMVLMAAAPACAVGWGLLKVFSTPGEVDPSGPSGTDALAVPWWAIGIVLVGLPLLAGLLAGVTDRPARRLRLG